MCRPGKRDPNFIMTVSVHVMAPNGARSSAATELTTTTCFWVACLVDEWTLLQYFSLFSCFIIDQIIDAWSTQCDTHICVGELYMYKDKFQ